MITGIFLLLAAICVGLYFWSKGRQKVSNRYRRKKIVPAVSSRNDTSFFPEDEIKFDENELDPLGIPVAEKKAEAVAAKNTAAISPQSDFVVVVHVMAPDDTQYAGYELLQALLSAGLRFGKNRIFARHAHKDGRGDILFYCASAVSPGVFDLTKMGTVSCPGLSLFFSASAVAEPMMVFDSLLETIDQLIEDLGGAVLDDTRAPLSKEKILKYRHQIRVFENSKNTADMFA
jgi:cell division protein ZipA